MKNSLIALSILSAFTAVLFALVSFFPRQTVESDRYETQNFIPSTSELIRKKEQRINLLESETEVILTEIENSDAKR